MQFRIASFSPRLCLGTFVFVLLSLARLSAAQVELDSAGAMPPLPGFSSIQMSTLKAPGQGGEECWLTAVRDADGLKLHVSIDIAQNAEAIGRVVHNVISTPEGIMPPGSHTGRKFGDEVWHSVDQRGGPDRGGFTLVTRTARAVICVAVMEKITERVNGGYISPFVDEADMKLAEDLTNVCLQRLVKMGIGTQAAATPIDAPPVSDVLREVIAPVGVTPGFTGVRYRAVPRGEDEIEVTRRRDGTRMVVHLSISAEIGEAMTKARTVASSQTGKLSAGSLTGRVFGNELWHAVSSREDGGRNLSLVTRMGSAVVRVDLIERGNKQPADGVGTTSAENDDMKLAEEVTVGCLKRLVARGIGSHGATFFRDPPPPPRP